MGLRLWGPRTSMQDFQVAISQAPLLCLAHRYVLCSLRPPGLQHIKASLSITNSQSLLKLMSIAIQPSHPLSPLLLLLSISQHQGTLHTLIATCFLWQRYYTCFSCEDSGPKRLRFGAWLHSFRRTQRGLERPLKKGLQFSIKSGIDHKLSPAFPTSLYGLRCARPMMNPLSDAHRGNLLSTE